VSFDVVIAKASAICGPPEVTRIRATIVIELATFDSTDDLNFNIFII
jgi:hypothetical protein